MPDFYLYGRAIIAAILGTAVQAAILHIRTTERWLSPSAAAMCSCFVGLMAGYGTLGFDWVLPPAAALDRFLVLILPAVLLAEAFADVLPRWLTGTLRLGISAVAGRILLHNSVYLRATPGSVDAWPAAFQAAVFFGSTIILGAGWWSLLRLCQRPAAEAVPVSLSLSLTGGGIATMLAGYLKGGTAALPPAVVVGVIPVLLLLSDRQNTALSVRYLHGTVSLGIVALFSLLWIGRFFGQLTTVDVIVIFLAPQLCWITEFPVLQRLTVRLRILVRLTAVGLPVSLILWQARMLFLQKLAPLIAQTWDGVVGS